MHSGAMGMPVNQRLYAVLLHDSRDFFGGDVDDVGGFHRRSFQTLVAQFARQRLTL